MDKLIFLGTGHALAYHCYSTCLALTDGTHTFMTDAGSGNGVLLQMERAGLTSDDITDLFISHRHTDQRKSACGRERIRPTPELPAKIFRQRKVDQHSPGGQRTAVKLFDPRHRL